MKPVFVDTMGWFSMFDRRDAWHQKACAVLAGLSRSRTPLLTTDYVVDETATLLLMRGAGAALDAFFSMLSESRALTLAAIGPGRFQDACSYFLKHRDQGYSFTDVTSFLVMRELRCRDALTHDEHFERAGFSRLLR